MTTSPEPRWSWLILRAALLAIVVCNGAIAITALIAAVLSLGDFVSPLLWRCGSLALTFGWILQLETENRRMKSLLRRPWSPSRKEVGL